MGLSVIYYDILKIMALGAARRGNIDVVRVSVYKSVPGSTGSTLHPRTLLFYTCIEYV